MAIARTNGFNAITLTGGEQCLPSTPKLFKDRIVAICYDNDTAGKTGAYKVANCLLKYTPYVKVVLNFHEGMEEKEEEEEEGALDEHVWLSLKNAAVLTEAIEKALAEIDPENASLYEANLAAYLEKLSTLDAVYAGAVKEGAHDTLLFGDRFPFRYLTEDYGLKYYAAFSGCSAETEASFETILFLADKVDELGLSCILTIDGSDQKIAGTVAQTAKSGEPEILTLNSIQSITKEDMESGTTYLSVMEENLEVLKKALQ